MPEKDYILGLDIGTSSIGWCVTDTDYNIIRKRGRHLWGARLIDNEESKSSKTHTAASRRKYRRQRRSLNKRNWRLHLLKQELKPYVNKEDPSFLSRIKSDDIRSLFNDKNYQDSDYYKEFPTIYHLRESLKDENKSREYLERGIYYRLLFLAAHDILKNRGHFVNEDSNPDRKYTASTETSLVKDFTSFLNRLTNLGDDNGEPLFKSQDVEGAVEQFRLKLNDDKRFQLKKSSLAIRIIKAIFRYKVDLKELFGATERLDIDFSSADYLAAKESIIDNIEIFDELNELYSNVTLFKMIGSNATSISDAKIKVFNKHKKELQRLKSDIKKVDSVMNAKHYDKFFRHNNHPVFSIRSDKDKPTTTSENRKEELIKKLKVIREEYHKLTGDNDFMSYLQNDKEIFLETPNGTTNRTIPFQLHLEELKKIMNGFIALNRNSDESKTVKDHLFKLLEFKVPYYCGPLSNSGGSDNYWLVKKAENKDTKVTPYNFDEVVDQVATNKAFITKMLRNCTYLSNECCLAQDTILYQTYIFYNIFNKMKINGHPLKQDQKIRIFESLIKEKRSSLSNKAIINILNLDSQSVIEGINIDSQNTKVLKISLSAIRKMQDIFGSDKSHKSVYAFLYDDVVNGFALIDAARVDLRRQELANIISRYPGIKVTKEQEDALLTIRTSKWGNLSKALLSDIKNARGETIITILERESHNLNEILFDNGGEFLRIFDDINGRKSIDFSNSDAINDYLKDRYIAPQVRRGIIQAMLLIKEIRHIMKQDPKNIVIEFTRASDKDPKETSSRIAQIQKAYKDVAMDVEKVKKEISDLSGPKSDQKEINDTNKPKSDKKDIIQRKKIYLYFLQAGRDIYTGKPIDLRELLDDNSKVYDVDHIVPKSLILNNSVIVNLVLTSSKMNGLKGDAYPINEEIRKEQKDFWNKLKAAGLMDPRKYERLIRDNPLTEDEINEFINRQKTTTDWINKEIAKLLQSFFKKEDETSFIIYSKARNVSDFRNTHDIIKIRELNNHHHAHDAYLNIVVGKTIHDKLTYRVIDDKRKTNNIENLVKYILKNEGLKKVKEQIEFKDQLITKKYELKTTGAYWKESLMSPKKDEKMLKSDNEQQKGKQPLKNNDIRFGYYDMIQVAFFSLIKAQKNKKTTTRLLPIFTYECSSFLDKGRISEDKLKEFLPKSRYLNENGLKLEEVIVPKIAINTLLLVDGVPLRLAGKTADSFICHNQIETTISFNVEEKKLLKKILSDSKTIDDNDENIKMMNDIFMKIVDLVKDKKYSSKTKNRFDENSRDVFVQMSFDQKLDTIKTILTKLIKASGSNQGKLFNLSYSDPTFSLNIGDGLITIIEESITGFYRKKVYPI
ncbi:MAG: type II CRISPR RNA-guided endonuclease Cas9 [Erysipelotrichaceae bacterium]|jgi:CRISPR-associated endonuclease Csn1|nr:type II CRISPR RNA-guided endonuclease Cas9 [Erysipelotrichaceae bacterium]